MQSGVPTSFLRLPHINTHKNYRLSGAFDDPLICKDVAKKERASRTLEDTAHKEAAQQSCENSASAEEAKKREGAEHSDARSGQNSELYLGEVSCKHADEENQEKAQEKQVWSECNNRHRTKKAHSRLLFLGQGSKGSI